MESLTDQNILKTIAFYATPLLIAAVCWFLRNVAKEIHDMRMSLSSLHLGQALSQKDIDALNKAISGFKATSEDVAVLKHEQSTIWRRIDEIRTELHQRSVNP